MAEVKRRTTKLTINQLKASNGATAYEELGETTFDIYNSADGDTAGRLERLLAAAKAVNDLTTRDFVSLKATTTAVIDN